MLIVSVLIDTEFTMPSIRIVQNTCPEVHGLMFAVEKNDTHPS